MPQKQVSVTMAESRIIIPSFDDQLNSCTAYYFISTVLLFYCDYEFCNDGVVDYTIIQFSVINNKYYLRNNVLKGEFQIQG